MCELLCCRLFCAVALLCCAVWVCDVIQNGGSDHADMEEATESCCFVLSWLINNDMT